MSHVQTDAISEALLAWDAQQTKPLLMVIAPPRSGKTTAATHYMRQALTRTPAPRIAYATYRHDTANLVARRLTPHTPAWIGAARDAITGPGIDRFLVDDPTKNQEQADSPAHRRDLWDWWHNTAAPRINPTGRMALITSRWREDDLPGQLLNTHPNQWTVLDLT